MTISLHTARILCNCNRTFYQRVAPSFSDTRHAAWPGQKVCSHIISGYAADQSFISVLDIASGNARFEALLGVDAPNRRFLCTDVDASDSMAHAHLDLPKNVDVAFKHADILQPFISAEDGSLSSLFEEIQAEQKRRLTAYGYHTNTSYAVTHVYHACVCFGFFHHIPIQKWRIALLHEMLHAVDSHGIVAVSLWCFLRDRAMARRAHEATQHAYDMKYASLVPSDLGEGDYFLGWQNKPIFRYCHSFSDREIDELANICPPEMRVMRFACDGKNGMSNEYLVFVPANAHIELPADI